MSSVHLSVVVNVTLAKGTSPFCFYSSSRFHLDDMKNEQKEDVENEKNLAKDRAYECSITCYLGEYGFIGCRFAFFIITIFLTVILFGIQRSPRKCNEVAMIYFVFNCSIHY